MAQFQRLLCFFACFFGLLRLFLALFAGGVRPVARQVACGFGAVPCRFCELGGAFARDVGQARGASPRCFGVLRRAFARDVGQFGRTLARGLRDLGSPFTGDLGEPRGALARCFGVLRRAFARDVRQLRTPLTGGVQALSQLLGEGAVGQGSAGGGPDGKGRGHGLGDLAGSATAAPPE